MTMEIDTTLDSYKQSDTVASFREDQAAMFYYYDEALFHPPLGENATFLAEMRALRAAAAAAGTLNAAPAIPSPNAPRSSLDAALMNPTAGLGGGGGADELHVLVRASDDAGDVFAPDISRATCELKRAIERDAMYAGEVCERAGRGRDGPCHSTFSAFDVRTAYRMIGLGGAFDGFVALATSLASFEESGGGGAGNETVADALRRARDACAAGERGEVDAGEVLCASTPSLGCDAAACAGDELGAKACVVGGGLIDACAWLDASAVTPADVRALAAFPTTPLDAGECGALASASGGDEMRAALRVGAVAIRWARAGERRMASFAMPWRLLASDTFGETVGRDVSDVSDADALRSDVTRLVFRLRGKDLSQKVSAATKWAMHDVGPNVIETWRARSGDGGRVVAAASWRQTWAFRELGLATLWEDLRWAIGSGALTFAFVWWHTSSLFLTVGGMAAVCSSLIAAQFVYVYVVGVTWVGLLSFIGIFLILGIGVDDVFIILEFWRQAADEHGDGTDATRGEDATGALGDNALVNRMTWTVRKSQYVVTMTSLTTAMAFAINLSSQIAPIRLFGAFMTALVACNYWLVCTSFPALLVLRHRWGPRTRRAARRALAGVARGWRRATRRRRRRRDAPREEASASTAAEADAAAAVVERAHGLPPATVVARRRSSYGHVYAVAHRRRPSGGFGGGGGARGAHHRRFHSTVPCAFHPDDGGVFSPKKPSFSSVGAVGATASERKAASRTTRRTVSLGGGATGIAGRDSKHDFFFDALASPDSAMDIYEYFKDVAGTSSSDDAADEYPDFVTAAGSVADADERRAARRRLLPCCGAGSDPDSNRKGDCVDRAIHRLADFVVAARWPIVIVAVALFVGAAVLASRIEPSPQTGFTIFPEDHNVQRYARWSSLFGFASYEEAVRVRFVWGLEDAPDSYASAEEMESESRHPFAPKRLAIAAKMAASEFETPGALNKREQDPTLDAGFDVEPEASQAWLLSFCDALRRSEETSARLADPSVGANVDCFIEDVNARVVALSGGGAALPLPRDAFRAALATYELDDARAYARQIRWFRKNETENGHVASVSIHAVLRASALRTSAETLTREAAFWERWFRAALETAPVGLRGGFQTSETWIRVSTEREVVTAAWSALAFSLAFAFGVLYGASRSARLAALATVSVGHVATTFLAFAVLRGWSVGVVEAVCTMVLVGLSLDYILHVAGAYVRIEDGCMKTRARGALTAVTRSVASGCSTTVGAALFLLGCTVTFFTKFGLFITWTLTAALVQACVVFPATCAVCGPEGRKVGGGGGGRRARGGGGKRERRRATLMT